MATFDGIIPELAKAGFIKKVNDLRSQISTLQQEIDTISESTKTMFWSNSIPSDLGTVGELQSFSVQVKAYSLIDVPPTYSIVAGSLPSGLTLNPINGYITGVVGNYETITPCVFTVQAADNQTTITKQFTITVNAVNDAPTWITASELGDMTVDFISIQLSVNDPDSTPTFTIVDGSLPSGVTLSSSGLISGANPRDNLTYTFTVEANDGTNQVQRQFTFVAFNEAPVWVTDGDLGTITGSLFSKSLSATDNDSASLTYSVNPLSALPVGVNLSNSGVLSGLNPLTNTTHTFDIDVSDGVNVVTRTFFFYAYNEAPVWVSNASLGSFNTPTISIQLSATDAENENLTYAVVAGTLPSGLELNLSGLLFGNNPFDGLTSSFTIAVSDKVNSVNREFSITCEVAAGEAIYTSVGNYQFTVPTGVYEIDALAVAGATGLTSVSDMTVTNGGNTTYITGNPFAGFAAASLYNDNDEYLYASTVGILTRTKDLYNWENIQILNSYNLSINLITKLNGIYFACGAGGLFEKSLDGVNFTHIGNFGTVNCNGVVYLNGLYLAFGASGYLLTSTDASTWTSRTSQFSSQNISGLIYANGLFIAYGGNGLISTSPNGITWTSRTSQLGTQVVSGLIYANDLFVARGGGLISTSPDGLTWTLRTSQFGSYFIYGLVYANGLFVAHGAGGTISTSSDGLTWTIQTSGFTSAQAVNSIVYANGLFVAVGAAGVLSTSSDGYTWTNKVSGFGTSIINKIEYINNKFILVGDANKIGYSNDGVSYYAYTLGNVTNKSFAKIAFFKNNYFFSGTSGVSGYTSDFVNFNYNVNYQFGVDTIYCSCKVTDSTYLASGSGGVLYKTEDSGKTWYKVNTTGFGAVDIYEIIYANGLYIAISGGTYYTSTDGIAWVSRVKPNSESGYPRSLVFYNGYFYCIFSTLNYNSLYKSQDGVNWTRMITTSSGYPRFFNYVNGKYLFTTDSSRLYGSDDGVTWTDYGTSTGISGTLNGIDYFNGFYLFYCNSSYVYVTRTTDLVSFTSTSSLSTSGVSRMVKSANSVYLLGGLGALFSSIDGITWLKQDAKFGGATLQTMQFTDDNSYFVIGNNGTSNTAIYTPRGTLNTDATLTRPSTEGFSLTNPNDNGNYGKLSGIAGYKNNIPVNPNDTINVSVPSLDGAVRIIWGGGRDFPNNAV